MSDFHTMNIFRITGIFLLMFLILFPLHSQTESPGTAEETVENNYSPNPELDTLLDFALSSAEQGDWEGALKALDEAEKLDPRDPRITSYRKSILELSALDQAQQSWVKGSPAEVDLSETEASQGIGEDEEGPKFVIDRGESDKQNPPSLFRDMTRLDLGVKFFAVNPLSSETINTWSSGSEFAYSSLRADFRYWMPFLGRSLGFSFRSNGYSWAPGNPDILFNALDIGINLRGFLMESENSRLELGIDFGASMLTTDYSDDGVEHLWALFLGLWGADPLFYHIFKVESLENLVFGGGLRIYSSDSQEILETVNYRVDAAWYFNRGFSGIRFEWWDFTAETAAVNMMSFSLFGGYRY